MLKKLFVLPLAIAAAVSFASPAVACGDNACVQCEVKPGAAPAPKAIKGEAVTSTYKVEGMHCQNCVNAVNAKLAAVPGVGKVNADLAKKAVAVTHEKGQAGLPKLQAALGDHFKLAALTPGAAAPAASSACCEGGADACKDTPAADKPTPKK